MNVIYNVNIENIYRYNFGFQDIVNNRKEDLDKRFLVCECLREQSDVIQVQDEVLIDLLLPLRHGIPGDDLIVVDFNEYEV